MGFQEPLGSAGLQRYLLSKSSDVPFVLAAIEANLSGGAVGSIDFQADRSHRQASRFNGDKVMIASLELLSVITRPFAAFVEASTHDKLKGDSFLAAWALSVIAPSKRPSLTSILSKFDDLTSRALASIIFLFSHVVAQLSHETRSSGQLLLPPVTSFLPSPVHVASSSSSSSSSSSLDVSVSALLPLFPAFRGFRDFKDFQPARRAIFFPKNGKADAFHNAVVRTRVLRYFPFFVLEYLAWMVGIRRILKLIVSVSFT